MATRKRNSTITAEPAVPTVTVEWLVTTSNASHKGGAHIGDRHYSGRAGEQVEIREDDAEVLLAAGFVQVVAEQVA